MAPALARLRAWDTVDICDISARIQPRARSEPRFFMLRGELYVWRQLDPSCFLGPDASRRGTGWRTEGRAASGSRLRLGRSLVSACLRPHHHLAMVSAVIIRTWPISWRRWPPATGSGLGPANLVATLSAIAVFTTFVAPGGLLVSATQTPVTAAGVMLLLMLGGNAVIGSLKTSRDRLAAERERYARLAESRDLLYRELQHRVSNNIQIISGLLLLQSQGVGDRGGQARPGGSLQPHRPDRPHPAPVARPGRRAGAVPTLRPRPARPTPSPLPARPSAAGDRGRRGAPACRTGHAGVPGAAGMRQQRPGARLHGEGGECGCPWRARPAPCADRGRRRAGPARRLRRSRPRAPWA